MKFNIIDHRASTYRSVGNAAAVPDSARLLNVHCWTPGPRSILTAPWTVQYSAVPDLTNFAGQKSSFTPSFSPLSGRSCAGLRRFMLHHHYNESFNCTTAD